MAMGKTRIVLFYLGWAGNFISCISALATVFICSFWIAENIKKGFYATCIALFIVALYNAYASMRFFQWLKQPQRENAFVFIFYWVFSVFVLLLACLISLGDFSFIGAH
jgi:hypothetical protein